MANVVITDGNGNVIPGNRSMTNSDKTGVYVFDNPLPPGTVVNVDISTGITSPGGVPMAAPFHSHFTTIANEPAPVILSVSPADNVFATPTEVVVVFEESINHDTWNAL